MKIKELQMEIKELRLRTINEVALYIMEFADYTTLDTFHIPLDIMKSLINGVIPYQEGNKEVNNEN